jgi:hypothetical protein
MALVRRKRCLLLVLISLNEVPIYIYIHTHTHTLKILDISLTGKQAFSSNGRGKRRPRLANRELESCRFQSPAILLQITEIQ